MVAAIGLPFDVLSYEEHSRGQGSGAMAVSYIEITTRSRRTLFGAGMHSEHHHGLPARHCVGGESRDRLGRAAAGREAARTGT